MKKSVFTPEVEQRSVAPVRKTKYQLEKMRKVRKSDPSINAVRRNPWLGWCIANLILYLCTYVVLYIFVGT